MRERIPSQKTIEQAEEQQTAGNYAIARSLVSNIESYPLGQFSRLNVKTRRRFLKAAIIHTSSSINRANNSCTALEMASNLAQARKVIVDIYDNTNIQKAAQTIKDDAYRNPYEFSIEMGRGKISYLLTLAALTGNHSYIIRAIEDMNQLITQAEEPTTKTLLHFERQRLIHRQLIMPESFDALTQAFQQATDASIIAGNLETVARVAAQYTIDALNMNMLEAADNGQRLYNYAADHMEPSTIMTQEIEKEEQNEKRCSNWNKMNPDREEYSFLDLPR